MGRYDRHAAGRMHQLSRFPLTPQRIVHDARQVMPEDGIVCLDKGMYKSWVARNKRTRVADTMLLDVQDLVCTQLPYAVWRTHCYWTTRWRRWVRGCLRR